MSENEIGFSTDLNQFNSKYYLNLHKPNEHSHTSYPTLTNSQQINVSNIQYMCAITNNYVSVFSDYELIETKSTECSSRSSTNEVKFEIVALLSNTMRLYQIHFIFI